MASLTQARALRLLAPQGKRASNAGKPDLIITKDATGKPDSLGDRSFRFAISNGDVDRDRDTVALGGWDLLAYSLNPVVCLEHGHIPAVGMLPIGTASDLKVEGIELKATLTFEKADVPVIGPYAEMAVRLCKSGTLRACSVGFVPLTWEFARDGDRAISDQAGDYGVNFTSQELMEISICGVPCNPGTLVDPVQRSVSRSGARLAAPPRAATRAAPSFDKLPPMPAGPGTPLVRMSGAELRDYSATLDEWLAENAAKSLSIGDALRYGMVKDRADEAWALAAMAR